MTDKVYRQAFEQAKTDLASAVDRKAAAEKEAATAHTESIYLRRTVAALAALCGENVEDSMGLTEAVRLVFETRNAWTLMKDVKDQVEAVGVSLSDLKNPDASVLSVLNRLVAAGELQTASTKLKNATGAVVDARIWKPKPKPASDEPLSDDDIPF